MAKIAVAPLVGAWIEIKKGYRMQVGLHPSLPSWERGLKYKHMAGYAKSGIVAPLVGAWIEILFNVDFSTVATSRSPRGSVD